MKDTSQTKKAEVSRMGLNLYEHNEKAYKSAVAMMQQYGKAAIVHPTGTGEGHSTFKLIKNCHKTKLQIQIHEYLRTFQICIMI